MAYHSIEHYFFKIRHPADNIARKIIHVAESDFPQIREFTIFPHSAKHTHFRYNNFFRIS